jgi:hypothetical protein
MPSYVGPVSGAGAELVRCDCRRSQRVRVFVSCAAAASAVILLHDTAGEVSFATLTLASGIAQTLYIDGPAGIVSVRVTPTVSAQVIASASILEVT